MATNICSSTSTTDLHQRHTISSDSFAQTTTCDHNDDDYANYEETRVQQSLIPKQQNNVRKLDKTTLCRTNCYSVGCWTKPAYLNTNS